MPIVSTLALTILGVIAVSGAVQAQSQDTVPAVKNAVWPAPVGHRQPRAKDLPPSIARDEGARTQRQKSFDERLQICRAC